MHFSVLLFGFHGLILPCFLAKKHDYSSKIAEPISCFAAKSTPAFLLRCRKSVFTCSCGIICVYVDNFGSEHSLRPKL